MKNQKETLTLKFEIENGAHTADAKAAASSMEAVAAMIEEVHRGFNDNHQLLIKARPFNSGSFEMPLDLIVIVAVTGIGLYETDIISGILNIIKEYFQIKNLLKGRTPKIDDGNIVIEGNIIKANKITINLLSPSNPTNKLVSKAIKTAVLDDSIQDMKIIKESNDEKIAHVKKSEFGYYEISQNIVDVPEESAKNEEATLIIYGPILDANAQITWRFIRDGRVISANIADSDFLSKVEAGENFASGDTLKVDLLTRQKYDQMYNTYIDAKMTVTKVHSHTKKPEQTKFDFDRSG